jgi:hypothetical protein
VNRSHGARWTRRTGGFRRSLMTLVGLLAATLMVSLAAPAQAGTALGSVVSAVPAGFTPDVDNGAVYQFLQVGSTMYAGGSFTSVTAAAKTSPAGTFTRAHLVAFNASTGSIGSLAPTFDGDVWALASDGSSLYVGGEFKTVDGLARYGLVKIDLATGKVVTAFNAKLHGRVTSAQVVAGRLIVSGTFAGHLRALDLTTGADTGYIKATPAGSLGSNAGLVDVYRFAVNSAGTELVGIGNFSTVDGAAHPRAFMLDLGTTSATLSSWNYAHLADRCSSSHVPAQLRGVDFAPDGSYFVIVAGGYVPATSAGVGVDLCDAAARFETATLNPAKPTWVNYTGGDTLHSVVVTDTAVYVQGHQRWLDNPQGRDSAGTGAVSRPGIGAIDPKTGLALSWNPTKGRGIGGKVLYTTAAGLWVGSDTVRIANRKHPRLALMPTT